MLQQVERETSILSTKAVALSKVGLLEADFFTHSSSVEHLSNILTEGIISRDFARRIGKDSYKRRWYNPINRRYVSVTDGSSRPFGFVGEVLILVGGNSCKFLGQELVDKPVLLGDEFEWMAGEGEYYRRWRIPPRDFIGLALMEFSQANLVKVKGTTRRAWSERPDLAVPIYSFDPNRVSYQLLWPRQGAN